MLDSTNEPHLDLFYESFIITIIIIIGAKSVQNNQIGIY